MNELKFTFDRGRQRFLGDWLASRCPADPRYPASTVSSIYLDTRRWALLDEKANSDFHKLKARIRWYADLDSGLPGRSVHLEVKFKRGPRREKLRIPIAADGAEMARLDLDRPLPLDVNGALRAHGVRLMELLRPAFRIDYCRQRFLEPTTGENLCLDSGIRVAAVSRRLFARHDPCCLRQGVFELKGPLRTLTPTLRPLVRLGCRRNSFSKYLACYEKLTGGGAMNWTEWLADERLLGIDRAESTAALLLLALAGSLVTSLLIAVLYVKFYERRATGSQVHRAFLLIGPAITAIFIAVQFSLPLSLGLLGALSIVRFRMPIKEAEEIGFILLIVAVSVSWATLNLKLLGIVLLVSVVGLFLTSFWPLLRGRSGDGMLVVSLPRSEYRQKSGELMAALDGGLRGGRLESISEGDEQATLSYTFSRLDGAELAELRRSLEKVTERLSSQVFFNQSGAP